jgi:hypothetical protein
MSEQTIALSTTTASVGVTLVSLMVPNATNARAVDDQSIYNGYVAALTAVTVLGLVVSILDKSPLPLISGVACAGVTIAAHNSIQKTNHITNTVPDSL